MKRIIQPSNHFTGVVSIPASKSVSQRVLALSAMLKGRVTLTGVGDSDDENAAIKIIEQLGALVERNKDVLTIDSTGVNYNNAKSVHVNESGLATRMFIPILANATARVKVTGEGSILNRPMHFFHEVLPLLGVEVDSEKGTLPLVLKGPLQPTSIAVDGSLSSQYITGLVFGYVASEHEGDLVITIKGLKSKPYLMLTLAALQLFSVNLPFHNDKIYYQGPYKLSAKEVAIEGDWSSASFLIVGAAINGKVILKNLLKKSLQSDVAILEALQQFGASVHWENDNLYVQKKELTHFTFDATDCPDLFPPLAVLAVFGEKESVIKGIHRLYHKESNRALAIQEEFTKLGIRVTLDAEKDTMIVYPATVEGGVTVHSHGDHRMAMSLTLLGLFAKNPIEIDEPEVVSKSFPYFYEVIEGLVEG